jgi:nucleotide-binding universal stress UspA family protein
MRTEVSSTQLPETKLHGRRILVCLDRSKLSEGCLPYAISLAKTFGGAITLVHVMQLQHHTGPQMNDALGWEISRKQARGYLERLEKEVSKATGQPVDVRLEQGRPAARIVDLAREVKADLIVLGSRGEGEAPAWHPGSTVQQVLALARSSVFIAHPSSIAPTVVKPKRILVPLDGSLRTESVLPTATRIASAHGAEMLLVHVVQEPQPTALLQAAEDVALARMLAARLESGAKRYLKHLQQQLAHEVTSVRTLVVRHANEHQRLLETSHEEQIDLIVLSAHGSACDSAQSFGSVSAYLLTHSTVPLLVLQDLPESELHRAEDVDAKVARPSLRATYAPENV